MRTGAAIALVALSVGLRGESRLVPIMDGDRCGYADRSGSVAIAPQFRNCGDFAEGLAPVQVDKLWGYIDEKGAIALVPRFTAADPFSEGLAFVELDADSKAVIDRKGTEVFRANYYQHRRFREGLAAVRPVNRWDCFADGHSTEIGSPKDCPAGQLIPIDHEWGYVDTTGSMVIPPRSIGAEFHEGLAEARGGFIDRRGNLVIPGPFTKTSHFSDGIAAVQQDFNLWGYVNRSGGFAVPPTFESAQPIEDGRGLVKMNGKYGFIDSSGSLVVAARYDEARPFSEALAAVRVGSKWGFIDRGGGLSIPLRFDAAQSFLDGSADVSVSGKVFAIDPKGNITKSEPPSLGQTFRRLQGIEAPEYDLALDTIFSIHAIYKEQLRDMAANVLKKFSDPSEAEAAIQKELAKAGIREPGDNPEQERRPYGLLRVEVVNPPAQPELLAVLFHLNLVHCTDSSLTLYHFERSGVTEIHRIDHKGEAPWGAEVYHLAAPQFTRSDRNGSFLMLVSASSPRSGNGSYGLDVSLIRFDARLSERRIFSKEFGARDHQIAMEPNGFRLETISMEHDTMRAGYRVYPYRYEVQGEDVVRVAPIGFDAHDFVGEWGSLPWEEAAKWSDRGNLAKIQEWYGKIRDNNGYFGGEFGEPQVCDAQQKLWQISYGDDPIYFLVERKSKWDFILKSIGEEQQQKCTTVEWKPGQPFQTMFLKPLGW